MKNCFAAALLALFIGYAAELAAAPRFRIVPLGLFDAEHTRSDGYQSTSSRSPQVTAAGQTAGTSLRYSGSDALGNSPWYFDGAKTTSIGPTGGEYVRSDGYKYSFLWGTSKQGAVLGTSDRFLGSKDGGQSTWRFNGTTTVEIGLIDAEHTRTDGYRFSTFKGYDDLGRAIGTSNQFKDKTGSSYPEMSAWFFDGQQTIRLGYTDAMHTRNDGVQTSDPYYLIGNSGHVVGTSDQFNGTKSFSGLTTWLYDGTSTFNIGLTDADHTLPGGFQYSVPKLYNSSSQIVGEATRASAKGRDAWFFDGTKTSLIGLLGPEFTRTDDYARSTAIALSESGRVAGYSERFLDSASFGRSSWIYEWGTTREVGLLGSEFVRADGYRYNSPVRMNETGHIIGNAERFNGGSASLGQSAWLYDGADSIQLGLTDSRYTRDDGYQFSSVGTAIDGGFGNLNDAGFVFGSSRRFDNPDNDLASDIWLFNGSTTVVVGMYDYEELPSGVYLSNSVRGMTSTGQLVGNSNWVENGAVHVGWGSWFYDGLETRRIGLGGPEYARADGYRQCDASAMNDAGMVIGSSSLFVGNTLGGTDAWVYDPVSDTTYSLRLSERSDGYASSRATYLGDDGLVLGTYQLYGDSDADLGTRAFYFTVADGLHDLGELIDGGLDENGWELLANAGRYNAAGLISGSGLRTSQMGGQSRYLLLPIPEPPVHAMCLGAVWLASAWRRKRR